MDWGYITLKIIQEIPFIYIIIFFSDINECAYGNICPYNGVCENTPGSYKCNCNAGTELRGRSCVGM